MLTVKRSDLPNYLSSSTNKLIPLVVSGIVTLVGCLVLLGWILDINALKSVFPGLVSMKPNAAIAFLLSGISLWLLHNQPKKPQKRRIGKVLALAVAIFGLLTLAEYIFGWNLGIDRLLFFNQLPIEGNFPRGRVAINSALNFLLIGTALVQVSRKNLVGIVYAQLLTLIAAIVALQPGLGYVYGLPSLYQVGSSYKPMALNTAICFMLLCVGILFTNPQQGLMQRVTSESIGGFVARRLLLAAIAIPLILGWLVIQGFKAGLYDPASGLFFLLTASIVVFTILIWQIAGTIERIDKKRKLAEATIRQSQERYQTFIEQCSEGIWRFELEQPIPTEYSADEQIELLYQYAYLAECNNAMAQMYGYNCADEIVGARLGDFVVRSDANNIEYLRNFIRSGYRLSDAESYEFDKEGNSLYFLNNLVGIVENGALVRAWGTQRDITAQKAAQTELQESEARLRRLVDANIVGIILAGFDGKVIEANNAFLDMIGYSREDLLSGKVNFIEITPPEFRHLDEQGMAEMEHTGKHKPYEKEYIRKDGSRVPVLVGTAYLGGSQKLGVGYLVDLSERKRTEENLKQLSNQVQAQANTLNGILAASVDNIYVVDRLGCYQYVSAGAAADLGFTPPEVIGKTWRDLGLPAEVMEAFDRQREQVLASGKPLKTETDFITPNGLKHYEYIVAPLNENETIKGVVVISRDSTERKLAEEALKLSETRFRNLVEQSPFSTQILSPDGKTIQVNRAWEQLWGVTLDQIPDYNMLEDEQLVAKGIMPYIQKGFAGEATAIPAILYDPNESIPDRTTNIDPRRWVSAFIYPVKDEQGNIREVVLVHEDITTAKLAQEALQVSEAKFRRLADSNIIGVITADFNGSILEANDAFLQMLGYTRSELLAGEIRWRNLTPPEYLPQDERMITEIKRTGACPPFEKEYFRKDGSRVPVVAGVALLEGERDKTICFILDLSDRAHAEAALRDSEEKFRQLAENIHEVFWMTKAHKPEIIYISPAYAEIWGRSCESLYAQPRTFLQTIYPDDLATVTATLQKQRQGEATSTEYRIVRPDGSIRWIWDRAFPIRNQSGQLYRTAGIAEDITERKLAEQALRESQELLQLAFDAANLGMWDWNLKTSKVVWSGQHEHLFGLEPETFGGSYEAFYELIHPQDAEYVGEAIAQSMQRKTPFEAEFRVVHPDGSIHWIAGKGKFFYDENNEPLRLTGVVMDATERKLAEEALRISEAKFRYVYESNAIGLFFTDTEGAISDANDAFLELIGYTREDLLRGEVRWDKLTPSEYRYLDEQGVQELELFGSCKSYEKEYIRKDGSRVPVIVGGAIYEGTKLTIAFVVDLTELKYTQEVLQKREAELRLITNAVPALISYIDSEQRYRFNNKKYEEWFGFTAAEIAGKHLQEVFSASDYENIRPYVETVLLGQQVTFESQIYYKNVGKRYANITYVPQFDKHGQVEGFVALVSDITERKLAEAEITRLLELAQTNEQRFRFLAESIPVQVWTAQPDGRVDYANKQGLQYCDRQLEQLVAWGWQEIVHPDDRQKVLEHWQHSLNTGEPYELEFRLLRGEDQSYRWHLTRALPFRDSTGQILSWFGTNTDIEEQKRSQESLQFLAEASGILASSLDYETTLQSVADIAVSYIADWCAIDMLLENKIQRMAVAHPDPAKVQLGWELSRRYPREVNAPDGVPLVIRTGEPIVFTTITDDDLVATVKDPEYLRILLELELKSCMIVPLIAHGRTIGAMTFIASESGRRYTAKDLPFAEDLARRAALAVDNARLYQEAQQANRMKDEFLATLSHELRTPLNSMLGWTQLLRTRKFNEATIARALETIDRNTKSLAQLIEDVLDVSRIITGKLRLNLHPVELVGIIEAAIETVLPTAEAKEIHIEMRLDFSGVQVLADPARLQQVFWNLLSNAVKFTPKGGRVEVRLDYPPSDGKVSPSRIQVRVSDTGQGIKPDFLPFVFERFRQADGSTTRIHGGLGLGLAIVRHLVELHGGTVQAESPGVGQGATFTVDLPVLKFERVLNVEHSGTEDFQYPLLDTDNPTSASPSLQGLKVLVVDDEPDARELMSVMLAPYGANVTTAASASEALETLKVLQPDVLVSDLGMPKEDGYILIRKVRELDAEQGGRIPAIALTAYAGAEHRIRALAAGFQLHVPKPVNPSELAVAIANLAGRS